MKNKKAIVLTILGILTLIVSLVGATYAYFTASSIDSTNTIKTTATTGTTGVISLTNPTPSMHLNLSVNDMAEDNLGTYYATNDSEKDYDEEAIQREIAVVSVTGGEEDEGLIMRFVFGEKTDISNVGDFIAFETML